MKHGEYLVIERKDIDKGKGDWWRFSGKRRKGGLDENSPD